MPVKLPIVDLQTKPHRSYQLSDALWRARVTISIETEPASNVVHDTARHVMTALIATVAGYPFDHISCARILLLGVPAIEQRAEYDVRLVHQPEYTGRVTIVAEEDMALDGDAEDWQRVEVTREMVLQFGGALQLWLNLQETV